MSKEVSKESKLQKVKKHLRENGKVYIVSTITGLTCIVVTLVFAKKSKNQLAVIAETAIGNANTIHNQTINMMSVKKGHPGFPVWCRELNRHWTTQTAAAKELGLNPVELSKHIRGQRDHVMGLHFERMRRESILDETIDMLHNVANSYRYDDDYWS